MYIDRKTKEELNALSKSVFGTTSKWRKMMELGVSEIVQEDTKKLVVKDGKEEYETIKTPVMHKDQLVVNRLKRYTIDEVREFMLMVKDRQEQFREAMKRVEEEQKAKAAAKQTVAEEASGSAV